MNVSDRDADYMALALRLAAKGQGLTSPNPMVGAVIVSGTRVVGQGYHRRAGGAHAEVLALAVAGKRARGATLYVTLEPCSHTDKRTPPCVPAVIASGLRRVVIAMQDPNPHVHGRGIRILRRAGIEVTTGCLHDEAVRLNEAYTHWIRTGRPLVILKAAMTLDGKIATAAGESKWITGEPARRQVHQLRRRIDAVLVGIGTVVKDDPLLTARLSRSRHEKATSRQPIRVILDSRLRISPHANVVKSSTSVRTVIVTTRQAPTRRIEAWLARDITIRVVPMRNGRVSPADCLDALGELGITSVMIEGGSEVNASFVRAGLVNRLHLYIAPLLLGGHDAKGLLGGVSPKRMGDATRLNTIRTSRVGRDILMEARILS